MRLFIGICLAVLLSGCVGVVTKYERTVTGRGYSATIARDLATAPTCGNPLNFFDPITALGCFGVVQLDESCVTREEKHLVDSTIITSRKNDREGTVVSTPKRKFFYSERRECGSAIERDRLLRDAQRETDAILRQHP